VNRALLVIVVGVAAFAATLAVYIGSHLSNEAMAVLTGAACGVSAMLPAAIMGTLMLLRRRDAENVAQSSWQHTAASSQYPPVIVVTPPTPSNALPAGNWAGMYPQGFGSPASPDASGRKFSVIGEEEGAWNDEYRSDR